MSQRQATRSSKFSHIAARFVAWLIRVFQAETRPELDLNDRRLLELLGIDPEAEINIRGRNALREATVYACIKILAEAVGKLPCKVHQDAPTGARKATNHPLYPLLKFRPNPYMTASDMFRALEAQRNLFGNAYLAPEFYRAGPKRGQIKALWPVDAEKVEIWVDDKGLFGTQRRVWYVVRAGGEERRLDPEELVHLKGLTLDGVAGVSPIQYLRGLVESGAAGTQHVREFYRQGLAAKGIVHYTGDLNPEAERVFLERFERMAAGLRGAHRVALLPIGYQFQPLQISMVDAQFLETAQLTIRQIANVYGVKMHQLNDLSRATHTNIEQQQKQFYADTLQAILTAYEQELTYKLLTPSEIAAGYHIRFNVDSIVRSDLLTRYRAHAIGVQGGYLTPNEARSLEDLPAKPGGDELFINGAMRPLSRIVGGGVDSDEAGEADSTSTV